MDKIHILYFLEDRLQEGFIKALVVRAAKEELIETDSLSHDVRSARGGSRIINEFRNFIRYSTKTGIVDADLLVVTIDGNCKGYKDRVKQLEKYIKPTHPFENKIVYAIPDPHIERWYIMDQRAFRDGVGLDKAPDLPPYKCKKAHYKQVLNKTLKESNVHSLLGGAEYAEKIVGNIIDINSLGKQNAGFEAFIKDLRSKFRNQMKR